MGNSSSGSSGASGRRLRTSAGVKGSTRRPRGCQPRWVNWAALPAHLSPIDSLHVCVNPIFFDVIFLFCFFYIFFNQSLLLLFNGPDDSVADIVPRLCSLFYSRRTMPVPLTRNQKKQENT